LFVGVASAPLFSMLLNFAPLGVGSLFDLRQRNTKCRDTADEPCLLLQFRWLAGASVHLAKHTAASSIAPDADNPR
jgi:hypothetical protein